MYVVQVYQALFRILYNKRLFSLHLEVTLKLVVPHRSEII